MIKFIKNSLKITAVVVLMLNTVACKSSKKVFSNPKKETTTKQTTTPKINTSNPVDLEATSNVKVYNEVVKDYIKKFSATAKKNMQKHGIPASITLAQGILESGAGEAVLAQRANNHFGIKCHKEWAGEKVFHDDDAQQECFRKYNDPAQSFEDHSYFLTSRPRYASLFQLPKTDYVAWAKGLKEAGYATDKNYPNKLISLIERFELHTFDKEVAGSKYVAPLKNKTHTVEKGDTLYSLSKKYNISVENLKKLNNLDENSGIQIGQVLLVN